MQASTACGPLQHHKACSVEETLKQTLPTHVMLRERISFRARPPRGGGGGGGGVHRQEYFHQA